MQRESNDKLGDALLSADCGEARYVSIDAITPHHCGEPTWRSVINRDGKTNTTIAKINAEAAHARGHQLSETGFTPSSVAMAVSPTAASLP
jgi:hypothetical protein